MSRIQEKIQNTKQQLQLVIKCKKANENAYAKSIEM